MPKLTKRFLDAFKPDPNGKDVFAWDGELRGFGLRLKPSGAGSYIIQYRTAKGATRRYAFAQDRDADTRPGEDAGGGAF